MYSDGITVSDCVVFDVYCVYCFVCVCVYRVLHFLFLCQRHSHVFGLLYILGHIGCVDKTSFSGYIEVDASNPQLYQFVVSLSKTLYPHCFSRFS